MSDSAKQQIATYIAGQVNDGDWLGLGSGSTTELAIKAIGQRIKKESLSIWGLPTSMRTAALAAELGIHILHPAQLLLNEGQRLSWGFDGADAVDSELNLIKGRGAALLSEKIVAKRCPKWKILITENKLCESLDEMSIPIEVLPEALGVTELDLKELGALEISQRTAEKKYGPVITEHGNVILDVSFKQVDSSLESKIKQVIGVVESGLFSGFNPEVVICSSDEKLKTRQLSDGKISDTSIG